jgi:hypothetical protein
MTVPVVLEPKLVTSILEAGKWSTTADDNVTKEELPEEVVRLTIKSHRENPHDPAALDGIGLFALTMGAGRWGVVWTSEDRPNDPAGVHWAGPDKVNVGKHLMSYTIGGIGLPHLDTASAQEFFKELTKRERDAAPDLEKIIPGFVYNTIRNNGGERWEILKKWCRAGLRRSDMQQWVLEYWVENYWRPAREEVMKHPHGTLQEALVVARIWNTSKGAGLTALSAAEGRTTPEERIEAELATYPKKDRHGVMRRAATVYEFFQ